jgi:hypothetical protein
MSRSADTTLVHPTYRHLDRPIRIAGLTLFQWTHLTLSAIAAWALAKLLPFSPSYDLSVALSVTGAPAAIAIAAGTGETNPFRYLSDAFEWRRGAWLYEASGRRAASTPDVVALWDAD